MGHFAFYGVGPGFEPQRSHIFSPKPLYLKGLRLHPQHLPLTLLSRISLNFAVF